MKALWNLLGILAWPFTVIAVVAILITRGLPTAQTGGLLACFDMSAFALAAISAYARIDLHMALADKEARALLVTVSVTWALIFGISAIILTVG